MRRFKTARDHPHNVAPADENSLQNSIARDSSSLDPGMLSEPRAQRIWLKRVSGPVALADFMEGYSVEGMSFGPADDFDLERLLAQ